MKKLWLDKHPVIFFILITIILYCIYFIYEMYLHITTLNHIFVVWVFIMSLNGIAKIMTCNLIKKIKKIPACHSLHKQIVPPPNSHDLFDFGGNLLAVSAKYFSIKRSDSYCWQFVKNTIDIFQKTIFSDILTQHRQKLPFFEISPRNTRVEYTSAGIPLHQHICHSIHAQSR